MIYGKPIYFTSAGVVDKVTFGDGSDGDAVFTTSQTLNSAVEDTGFIEKKYKSLVVESGVSISAGNRNAGMIIRVQGDCTIRGSLINRLAPKTILESDEVDFSNYPLTMLTTFAGDGGSGGAGGYGSGGSYPTGAAGAAGGGMIGRFYGGGYGGGGGSGATTLNYTNRTPQAGAAGGSSANITTAVSSIFVGPAGQNGAARAGSYGGGASGPWSRNGGSYTFTGTNGGNGPGGNGGTANSSNTYGPGGGGGAGNYGGGVIILLVGGKLTIDSTASILCNGSAGGSGGGITGSNKTGCGGGGGGGGGGGRIFICHKGEFVNSGTLNVDGGAGGAAGGNGSSVGNTSKIAPGTGVAGAIGTIDIKPYSQYKEEDM